MTQIKDFRRKNFKGEIFMKLKWRILLVIIIFVCLLPMTSFSEEVKIFMVQSYSDQDLCGMPQLKGALKALENNGFAEHNSKIYFFFMDTKKQYTSKEQIAERGNIAYKKITTIKPDIVITFDDNAFKTLAPKIIHTQYKLIFSGINRLPEEYSKKLHFMDKNRKPTANITGVYEKLHIEDNLKLFEKITHKTGKVVFIYSDDSVGRILANQVRFELKDTEYKDNYEIVMVRTLTEYKDVLRKVNVDKSISAYSPHAHSLIDEKAGKRLNFGDTITYTLNNCNKPAVVTNANFCKAGFFGGAAVDFYYMGYQTGEMAAKALRGVDIKNIEIGNAANCKIIFNAKRAQQLKIKIPLDMLNTADEIY